jgi:purine-nucleoside phosphorylase
MENKAVVLMAGRLHFYEGYSIERITYPVRVLQRLGAQTIIITNAAGGKF